MDTNIHNYTCNGQEMDISININRDTNDKLCRHLIKIEKPSPSTWASTTSILHAMTSSQRQLTRVSLGNITNGFLEDKGMQTQAYKNGENFCYNIFTLQNSPPFNASQ